MNKKLLFFSLIAIIISFSVTASTTSQTNDLHQIYVGDFEIQFDRFFQDDTDNDGMINKISYFKNNSLVLTIWDNNQDGLPDAWFVYDEEEYLILQAEDLDGDGKPDEFSHFNRQEQITKKETVDKTTR